MLSNVSVSWSRFKGVKGCACRVPGGQRLRLQVHRGWSGRPTSIEQYWKLLTTFERLNTIEDFWTLFKAIEQNRTLVSIIGLGYTELYMVVLGCTRRCWVVLGYTRLYWTVLGCTGPYWAVLGCAGLYYTILGGIFFSLIIFPVLSCCHEGWTFLATAQLAKQKHQQYWQCAHIAMSDVARRCVSIRVITLFSLVDQGF